MARLLLIITIVLAVHGNPLTIVDAQEPQTEGEPSGGPVLDDSVTGENSANAITESPENGNEVEERWIDLLDETPLIAWRRVGGRAEFEEVDRVLVATIRAGQQTTFLCGDQDWGDFELSCQFRVDSGLNAGLHVRSRISKVRDEERFDGVQIEIDPSERSWTGAIYDQGRRSWLATFETRPEVRNAFKPEQWNTLRILVRGDSVTTWVNEIPAATSVKIPYRTGVVGIQVHSTRFPDPRSLRIRELRMRLIDSAAQPRQGD